MKNTPQELARFVSLSSKSGALFFFGTHPDDFGNNPLEWYRKNQWRFILPLEVIATAREPVQIDDIQGACGVYFLFLGQKLQYVGQSKHIQYRVTQHLYSLRPAMSRADWFDSISAIWVPRYFLDRVERHYLSALRPYYNSIIRAPIDNVARVRRKKVPPDIPNVPYDAEKIARILDGESRESVYGNEHS